MPTVSAPFIIYSCGSLLGPGSCHVVESSAFGLYFASAHVFCLHVIKFPVYDHSYSVPVSLLFIMFLTLQINGSYTCTQRHPPLLTEGLLMNYFN